MEIIVNSKAEHLAIINAIDTQYEIDRDMVFEGGTYSERIKLVDDAATVKVLSVSFTRDVEYPCTFRFTPDLYNAFRRVIELADAMNNDLDGDFETPDKIVQSLAIARLNARINK